MSACKRHIGFHEVLGKTALLKYVIRKFAEHGYNVGVTASTASAASLTKGFTIERFLGIFDVGMHGEELVYNLIQRPEVVKRLCQLDALIIDECSMVKPELFKDIDFVLQLCPWRDWLARNAVSNP